MFIALIMGFFLKPKGPSVHSTYARNVKVPTKSILVACSRNFDTKCELGVTNWILG